MNKIGMFAVLAGCLAAMPMVYADCASGVPLVNPDSDYVDNGDGTVTHEPTGLMWQRCPFGLSWDSQTKTCAGEGEQGGATYKNWSEALNDTAELNFAGHDDWRLPNVNELRSLLEWSCENFAINATFFPITHQETSYWSSTTMMSDPTMARMLSFSNGSESPSRKSEYFAVRAVRGGN